LGEDYGLRRANLPKTSVLIVDDHEAIRRTLRVRIEELPEFSVCGEAVNGVDAVEKAQLLTPNLVILDFAMPEMNGLEAATALKFMLPSTKLYLLTAHSNRELELAARDAGVDAVYSKYDDLSALFRRLKIDCVLSEASGEQGAKPENADSAAAVTPGDAKTNIH
jgi:DNA-binding NarL/FixJ family response regulator